MNTKPKVSIIVPIYNVEGYLEKCMESLVHQTLDDIEIVVVNDGSPDCSKDILLEYQKEYPDKVFYVEKENGGLSDARNFGMQYVHGTYVTFLDSDDYIDTNAYETMYKATENETLKVVECDFIFEYSDKTKIDTIKPYQSIEDYLIRGRVVAWNKLYKLDWLREQKIEFPKGLIYEDVAFFFSLIPTLDSIEEVGVVRKPFVHYVQRQSSISFASNSRVTDICKDYKLAIEFLKDRGLFGKYSAEIEYKFAKQALLRFTLTKVIHEKDKVARKKNLTIMWNSVNQEFPEWKKNKYMKKLSVSNLYLKLIFKQLYYAL